MLSHVVTFWTRPEIPNAADELIAGAEKYLRPIPGALSFHVGKMVPSHRAVVDATYQVGLCIQFADKEAEEVYQVHPLHLEFIAKLSPVWQRVAVYDFQ